jgi:molecular chaperone DnaK (HSP70)
VTPLSLGIETLGGVFTKLIDAQHHHPDARSRRSSPPPRTTSRP